jgi:Holliday junction DNA helicase RuvB
VIYYKKYMTSKIFKKTKSEQTDEDVAREPETEIFIEKTVNKSGRDQLLDSSLRPQTFDEYVGQEVVKANLKILLEAAKERNHQPEHLLFYGPPGLGKTTISHLVAKTLGANMKTTSGPAIEKVGDLASILTNLEHGDVLFIDEIHRLNKMIEEVLYPAMENGVIDIIIGKGPAARTIQLDIPPFTLVGATTRVALLSSPLRSRFSGGVFRLENYSDNEIEKIIKRSAGILDIQIEDEAAKEISKRARSTPRTANYLLKRARDIAQLRKMPLNREIVVELLRLLEIDEYGMNQNDRNLLITIQEKFKGGPVGINTLAASLSEEEETLEEVIEPYLLQIGMLERTPRGRVLTDKAKKHLGY